MRKDTENFRDTFKFGIKCHCSLADTTHTDRLHAPPTISLNLIKPTTRIESVSVSVGSAKTCTLRHPPAIPERAAIRGG